MQNTARTLRVLLIALVVGWAGLSAGPVQAGLLDQAKAQGWVGERPDGFAGVVKAGAPADVRALVDQVNAGRRAEYERIAKQQNTTLNAVSAVFGRKLIGRAPPGTFVFSGGAWVRK